MRALYPVFRWWELAVAWGYTTQRHYGMKLLAYTLINLRSFCGV
jgi:hypothetical protein